MKRDKRLLLTISPIYMHACEYIADSISPITCIVKFPARGLDVETPALQVTTAPFSDSVTGNTRVDILVGRFLALTILMVNVPHRVSGGMVE